jgi:hypothetical protein
MSDEQWSLPAPVFGNNNNNNWTAASYSTHADLFNFGLSHASSTSDLPTFPWPSPTTLLTSDHALLAAARLVLFGAAGERSATRSECARRVAQEPADDNVFETWSAIDANDGAAIARLVANGRVPNQFGVAVRAAIAQRAVARRLALMAQLRAEMKAESALLQQLQELHNLGQISIMYAIQCNAFSCIDALLDMGAGFSPGALHSELMPCVRVCSRSQIMQMVVNSNIDLLQLEESFLRTRQFGGAQATFPFLQIRSLLEDAFAFDQSYRRNQLFFTLERLCASRNAVPSANADASTVELVRQIRRLPRVCRAKIVQYAVTVPPPQRDSRRLVVARDEAHTWMRGSIADERPEERGGRELFIKFDNWDASFNEWIPAHSERLVRWIHPRCRAVAESASFEPNESIVQTWLRRQE